MYGALSVGQIHHGRKSLRIQFHPTIEDVKLAVMIYYSA